MPHTSLAFVAHTQPSGEGGTMAFPFTEENGGSSTTRTQDTLVSALPQGMRLGSSEVCSRLSQLPSYLINSGFRLYYFRLPEKLKNLTESNVWW